LSFNYGTLVQKDIVSHLSPQFYINGTAFKIMVKPVLLHIAGGPVNRRKEGVKAGFGDCEGLVSVSLKSFSTIDAPKLSTELRVNAGKKAPVVVHDFSVKPALNLVECVDLKIHNSDNVTLTLDIASV